LEYIQYDRFLKQGHFYWSSFGVSSICFVMHLFCDMRVFCIACQWNSLLPCLFCLITTGDNSYGYQEETILMAVCSINNKLVNVYLFVPELEFLFFYLQIMLVSSWTLKEKWKVLPNSCNLWVPMAATILPVFWDVQLNLSDFLHVLISCYFRFQALQLLVQLERSALIFGQGLQVQPMPSFKSFN